MLYTTGGKIKSERAQFKIKRRSFFSFYYTSIFRGWTRHEVLHTSLIWAFNTIGRCSLVHLHHYAAYHCGCITVFAGGERGIRRVRPSPGESSRRGTSRQLTRHRGAEEGRHTGRSLGCAASPLFSFFLLSRYTLHINKKSQCNTILSYTHIIYYTAMRYMYKVCLFTSLPFHHMYRPRPRIMLSSFVFIMYSQLFFRSTTKNYPLCTQFSALLYNLLALFFF